MSKFDSVREEIERLRDRAAGVRALACGVSTDSAHVRLLNYAAELERDVQDLEAKIGGPEAANE